MSLHDLFRAIAYPFHQAWEFVAYVWDAPINLPLAIGNAISYGALVLFAGFLLAAAYRR